MTRAEALTELGIDAAASPEEARRAYLRRVKRCGPERDPEGFKRLREAFELVLGDLFERAVTAAVATEQPVAAGAPQAPTPELPKAVVRAMSIYAHAAG